MEKILFARSKKQYQRASEIDAKAIIEAIKKSKTPKKLTSIALDEETIRELKKISEKLGLSYQVLMRMFILQGIKRFKGAA